MARDADGFIQFGASGRSCDHSAHTAASFKLRHYPYLRSHTLVSSWRHCGDLNVQSLQPDHSGLRAPTSSEPAHAGGVPAGQRPPRTGSCSGGSDRSGMADGCRGISSNKARPSNAAAPKRSARRAWRHSRRRQYAGRHNWGHPIRKRCRASPLAQRPRLPARLLRPRQMQKASLCSSALRALQGCTAVQKPSPLWAAKASPASLLAPSGELL